MPDDFYRLEFSEYLLIRKGYFNRVKQQQYLARHQTALIVEALVGKGQGLRYVMSSWPLDEDDNKELTPEQIRELLKKKREHDALRKLKIDGKRN